MNQDDIDEKRLKKIKKFTLYDWDRYQRERRETYMFEKKMERAELFHDLLKWEQSKKLGRDYNVELFMGAPTSVEGFSNQARYAMQKEQRLARFINKLEQEDKYIGKGNDLEKTEEKRAQINELADRRSDQHLIGMQFRHRDLVKAFQKHKAVIRQSDPEMYASLPSSSNRVVQGMSKADLTIVLTERMNLSGEEIHDLVTE